MDGDRFVKGGHGYFAEMAITGHADATATSRFAMVHGTGNDYRVLHGTDDPNELHEFVWSQSALEYQRGNTVTISGATCDNGFSIAHIEGGDKLYCMGDAYMQGDRTAFTMVELARSGDMFTPTDRTFRFALRDESDSLGGWAIVEDTYADRSRPMLYLRAGDGVRRYGLDGLIFYGSQHITPVDGMPSGDFGMLRSDDHLHLYVIEGANSGTDQSVSAS